MWRRNILIIIFIVHIIGSILAGPINKSNDTIDHATANEELDLQSSTSGSSESSAASVASVASESLAAIVPIHNENQSASPPPSISVMTPQRVITYDQRQDGKYNIRADLENFMILLVPPSPTSGAALLEMLAGNFKSLPKKMVAKKLTKLTKGADRSESNGNVPKPIVDNEQIVDEKNDKHFIEGRTPYHVDISADAVQSTVKAARSIPVSVQIVPLVPLSSLVPSLSSTISTISSSDSSDPSSSSSDLASSSISTLSTIARSSKAIHDSTEFRSNNAVNDLIDTNVKNKHPKNVQIVRDRDHELTDPDTNNHNSFIVNSDSIDELAQHTQTQQQQQQRQQMDGNDESDGWELTLIGDGIEQCGPDRKRDSYGICQFVSDDF